MSEFIRPASLEQFEANFAQIKPLMNTSEAYYESARCLFCYDAPCINACPTSIDIPLFIRQIHSGNVLGAAKTIYDSNYFGHACGKVCPTEVLCEGACVYIHQNVKPIEIGRLQAFASHKAMSNGTVLYEKAAPTGKKVAIIGAGPAGISCACELCLNGFEADIFEAKEQASGLTVHGVAPYKITNDEAIDEVAYLQKQFGFRVFYRQKISTAEDWQRLDAEYDALFIGIGLGNTGNLHLEGEQLEGCLGAVEFIEQLRSQQHLVQVADRVVVLGGGNTAMDAASECARMGASEVTIAYRRTKNEMGAYHFEYDLAKNVGAKGLFGVTPKAIEGKDGKVTGIWFARTGIQGNELVETSDTPLFVPCEWVLKATGQTKQSDVLQQVTGLQLDAKKRIIVNEHLQTSNPRYFSGGDAVNGGKEVVNAAWEGKKAAQSIVALFSH